MSRGILFVRTPDDESLERWWREYYPTSGHLITGIFGKSGEYDIGKFLHIVPVDCSQTYDCDICAEKQCPGCGMQVEVNLFTGFVICISCAQRVDRRESGYSII